MLDNRIVILLKNILKHYKEKLFDNITQLVSLIYLWIELRICMQKRVPAEAEKCI